MPEVTEINLSEYSTDDLLLLIELIDKEIELRRAEETRSILSQMRDLAATVGMTVEEIMEHGPKRKTKGVPKYQNPNNPKQTWTGRGKKPGWYNDALERGMSEDELRIR